MAIRTEQQLKLNRTYDAVRTVLGKMPPSARDDVTVQLTVAMTLIHSAIARYVNNWAAMPKDVIFKALMEQQEERPNPLAYSRASERASEDTSFLLGNTSSDFPGDAETPQTEAQVQHKYGKMPNNWRDI